MQKATIHSAVVGKAIPPGLDDQHAAVVSQWPRWSLGVRAANLMFVSGTGGTGSDGVPRSIGDPRTQTVRALDRLGAIVTAGGGEWSDIVKVRVFLDDPAHIDECLRGVEDFLREHADGRYPAFALVVAHTSTREIHAEIEAFAATGHESVLAPNVFASFSAGVRWSDYAHAVRVGNLWFTSGLSPLDVDGAVVGADAADQLTATLRNLEAVLAACGRNTQDLVKLTTWIDDEADVLAVETTLGQYLSCAFPDCDGPATTTLVAPLAQPGVAVLIEAVATSAERQVIRTAGAYGNRPGPVPYTQAVVVEIDSDEGSWLRRFSRPTGPPGLDPALFADFSPERAPLGRLVFLSAQAGLAPEGTLADGMFDQTEQVWHNMRAIVEAAGGRFCDLTQFDVYYADRSLYPDYNRSRISFLEQHFPDKDWFAGSGPRAVSPIAGAMIEIESIAILP